MARTNTQNTAPSTGGAGRTSSEVDPASTNSTSTKTSTSSSTRWILIALASGGFAALNGVFAKLTTTESTTSAAQGIASFLHLPEGIVEVIVRGACFALNLLSNGIMWALFTRALTAAPSTTQVSITNTAANFLTTALLGMMIFGESVRGMWWLGAGMMGAGCILVGMREEQEGNKAGNERDGVQGTAGEENIPLSSDNGEYHDDEGEGGQGTKAKDEGESEEDDLVRL